MGYCCRLVKWEIKVMIMKGKGERVLEYINQRNGQLLLNMIHDFGSILCLNRYAQFILNSNLSDAQSVTSTRVVHLSLCWMGMLPAEFYRIFNSTLSLGENQ